ncbi:hypothetical protein L211DRAFT_837000 [Terfezia boudieri ATCC MYA-4762]|uniref:Uncharacterized protein n=1 Tax=Terfezia boudieri ATCC MYA-4762 TaxID=1051890 RepID=A0A3N4LQL6_9PEZI|nr:hypothetical protein L211DRAFT_837000 [Terfezia boudieri ATCC MYA-4762]
MGSHIPMLLLRFQPSGGGWRGYKPRKAATLGDFNYFYSYMSELASCRYLRCIGKPVWVEGQRR